MRTLSEDVGNEILVNQYIFVRTGTPYAKGDFGSLTSAWNVLPHETFREEPTVGKGLRPARSPDLSTYDFYLRGILERQSL
jgi:hypothetical protein